MQLKMIAALSADGFIADAEGRIPWHVQEDVQHFRHTVAGHWVLLGRRTAEQMVGWFAEMAANYKPVTPVILSRHAANTSIAFPAGTRWATTFPQALEILHEHCHGTAYVAGGGEIYHEALSYAEELILSEIQINIRIGVAFPSVNTTLWHQTSQQIIPRSPQASHGMKLARWSRNSPTNRPNFQ